MNPDVTILYFVTDHFDAMKQFFVDLGLDVTGDDPSYGQVTPMLNRGRGCMIFCSGPEISLEERTDVPPSGPLYLQIEGIDEARLLKLKGKYSIKKVKGWLYGGEFYWIVPPGGGRVRALLK